MNIPTSQVKCSSQAYFKLLYGAAASEGCVCDEEDRKFLVKHWGFSHITAQFCCPQFKVCKYRPCCVHEGGISLPHPSVFPSFAQNFSDVFKTIKVWNSQLTFPSSPLTGIFILPLRPASQTNPLPPLLWCAVYTIHHSWPMWSCCSSSSYNLHPPGT